MRADELKRHEEIIRQIIARFKFGARGEHVISHDLLAVTDREIAAVGKCVSAEIRSIQDKSILKPSSLLNETFIKLVQRFGTDPAANVASLTGYIKMIVRSRRNDLIRKRNRRELPPPGGRVADGAKQTLDPTELKKKISAERNALNRDERVRELRTREASPTGSALKMKRVAEAVSRCFTALWWMEREDGAAAEDAGRRNKVLLALELMFARDPIVPSARVLHESISSECTRGSGRADAIDAPCSRERNCPGCALARRDRDWILKVLKELEDVNFASLRAADLPIGAPPRPGAQAVLDLMVKRFGSSRARTLQRGVSNDPKWLSARRDVLKLRDDAMEKPARPIKSSKSAVWGR